MTVARAITEHLGQLKPSQLSPLMTGALIAAWRTKYSPRTVYTYRRLLKEFCKLLEAHGAPRINLPRAAFPQARAVTAKPEELARMLQAAPPWLRLFMLLYLQCGLRKREVLALTPATWDAEKHQATVPVKGGGFRTVELTADVEILLAAAGNNPPAAEPFVFILRGRRMHPDSLRDAFERHKKKCGVNPEVTAHDLRRTAATILYHSTKDLRIAQQLLGHKNLASTLYYLAPLAPDEARRYAELLRFDKFQSEVKQ